jgi:hypothetical protein
VGKVLTSNGITRYERGTYDLVGGVAEGFCAAVELSDAVTWPKASVAEPLREELLLAFRAHLGRRRAAGSPSSTPHLAGGPRPTDATGLELRAADAGALPAARHRRSERDIRVGVVRP